MRRGAAARTHACQALRRRDLRDRAGRGGRAWSGRNGAGKTSTLRCLAGIVPLDSGRAECGGRVVVAARARRRLRRRLHRAARTSTSTARCTASAREEIEERMDAIVEFSELGDFIDVPVKAYSAGHVPAARLLDRRAPRRRRAADRRDPRRGRRVVPAQVPARGSPSGWRPARRWCSSRTTRPRSSASAARGGARRRAGGLRRRRWPTGCSSTTGCWAPSAGGSRVAAARARDGALEVAELELRDADGRRRHVFRPGEPLRVRARGGRRGAGGARAWWRSRCATSAASCCFRTDRPLGAVRRAASTVRFEVAAARAAGRRLRRGRGRATTRTRPPARLLDRVARFSVAADARRRGRRRPARHAGRVAGARRGRGGAAVTRARGRARAGARGGRAPARRRRLRRRAASAARSSGRSCDGAPTPRAAARVGGDRGRPDEVVYSTRRVGAPDDVVQAAAAAPAAPVHWSSSRRSRRASTSRCSAGCASSRSGSSGSSERDGE